MGGRSVRPRSFPVARFPRQRRRLDLSARAARCLSEAHEKREVSCDRRKPRGAGSGNILRRPQVFHKILLIPSPKPLYVVFSLLTKLIPRVRFRSSRCGAGHRPEGGNRQRDIHTNLRPLCPGRTATTRNDVGRDPSYWRQIMSERDAVSVKGIAAKRTSSFLLWTEGY